MLQNAAQRAPGDPGGVADIRLAPGDVLDVRRVDHEHGALAVQDVEDRFPIHPGALDRDVGASRRLQPVAEGEQGVGRRRESAGLPRALSVRCRTQQAGHHRLFMGIQPATARVQSLHCSASLREAGVPVMRLLNARLRAQSAHPLVLGMTAVTLPYGLGAPPSSRPALRPCHRQDSTRPPIFMPAGRGAPRESLPCQAAATMSDSRRGDASSCRCFSTSASRSRR